MLKLKNLKAKQETHNSHGRINTLLSKLSEFAKMDKEEVLKALGTSIDGLSEAEAKRRLEIYGINEVIYEKPPWSASINSPQTSQFGIDEQTVAFGFLSKKNKKRLLP